MYTLKQNKAKDFLRKSVFRKFFKSKWMSQYEKSKTLRMVLKKVIKKDQEWKRTRYQREFTYLMNAFDQWKLRLEERRDLIKQYNALTHYRGHLIIKYFSEWKSRLRVKRGLDIMYNLMVGHTYAPSFDQFKMYNLKTEIMHRDWISHRKNYIKG